jgi:hypothetical protein
MRQKSSGDYMVGLILVVILVLAAAGWITFRHQFPHGHRVGYFVTMLLAMHQYAQDHDGWYPDNGVAPLTSLQMLYPEYIVNAGVLAGLSGDERAVVELVRKSLPLHETLSGWHYVPGLRVDSDPVVAIFWDREPGLGMNAGRIEAGTRIVGFSDGSVEEIPAEQWVNFLKHQELKQSAAQADPSGARRDKSLLEKDVN